MDPIITFNKTHQYTIIERGGVFLVEMRPLHPTTKIPWQRSHRVTDQTADATPKGWHEPIGYSSLEKAQAAVTRKQVQMAHNPNRRHG